MRSATTEYLFLFFIACGLCTACGGAAAPAASEPTTLDVSVASAGLPGRPPSYAAPSGAGSARGDAWQGSIATLAKTLGDRLRWDTRPRMKVAVLDFSTPEGATCGLSAPLAEELTTRLFDHERFSIIERRMLAKVMSENSSTQTDLFDAQEVARLGRLVGADGIVIGTITAAQAVYTINARIIVTENAEVASVGQADVPRPAAEQRGTCRVVEAIANQRPRRADTTARATAENSKRRTCAVRSTGPCEFREFVGQSRSLAPGGTADIGISRCGSCGSTTVRVYYDGTKCWQGFPDCPAFGRWQDPYAP